MDLIVYDVEVFLYDWIVVFKNRTTQEKTWFHNDPIGVRDFINEDDIYIGFNSKYYDQYIIKAICGGADPTEIKALSDWIIKNQGKFDTPVWEHETLKGNFYRFNNADIRDDMQQGLSLKAIEGHLGLNIVESSIPFDIDRPLTQKEVEESIRYCSTDVEATDRIVDLRKDYLNTKISLGGRKGLEPKESLALTNAKLVAKYLNASPIVTTDEREYVLPDNLKENHLPDEVFDFFNQIYDKSIPDEELWKKKAKIYIGETENTIGWGGLHGAKNNYVEEETDDVIIVNADGEAFYPNTDVNYGYVSRAIPDPTIYSSTVKERSKAKLEGRKSLANDLKLVNNTTYGAKLNQYNELYDPLMARSTCITGQLNLLELAFESYNKIDSLEVIQTNTDGIMVSLSRKDFPMFEQICKKWEKRTGINLEFDYIKKIIQKDVNNYIEVATDGSLKIKGGYLVKGVSPVGAFNVNNNYPIVAKAIIEHFVNGVEVEETINKSDNILDFQIIAKIGSMYSKVFHEIDEQLIELDQKVNRVYSSKDKRYGKLFKYKPSTNQLAKIGSLPENCIIDNENQLSIDDIDKSFYIELAKKQINDYLGIKPKKQRKGKRMATKKTESTTKKADNKANVYEKLILARKMFLDENIKKSGKNFGIGFKYFELKDIIPTATDIFNELGLITIFNIKKEQAVMKVVNTTDQSDEIYFTIPFVQVESNKATNPVQALGSSVTYLKRYLYLNVLDIIEADEIEPTLTEEKKPTRPLNEGERSELVKEMTSPKGSATKEQLAELKEVLKELRSKTGEENNHIITSFATETNAFTSGEADRVDEMINDVKGLLNE